MTRAGQLRFQRLTRHFVHNFFDNELLAPAGEASKVFVSAIALAGALGLTLALLFLYRYAFYFEKAPPQARVWAAATDNLLMILMTMTIMGILAALAWDGLLPSRRDGHILGALPVSPREIFRARLFATVLLFCLILAAFAALPGLMLCGGQAAGNDWRGLARQFAGQVAAILASAAFVYFGAVSVQTLLLAALPYARFLRVSGVVQVLLLLGGFATLFLTPSLDTAVRLGWNWAKFLPPYWFFGLWQVIGGGTWPYGSGPAWAAVAAAVGSMSGALAVSALLHGRAMRKVVEGLPLAPRGPGLLRRAGVRLLNALTLRAPRERAVFWFAARTLSRHRSHRLLLAIYFGLGLSWVLAGLSDLLTSNLAKEPLRPNAAVCTIPLDLAAMLLIGMRVLFALPVEVKANWMVRISAPERGGFAAGAARKLMVATAILPMAILPLPVTAAAWGWRAAVIHLWLYLLETLLLAEFLMGRFHKFPFACSWLPGQANLKVKLGMYFITFAALSSFLGSLEAHILLRNATQALINASVLMGGWLAWLVWRRRGDSVERPPLRFEERGDLDLNALQLQ